MTKCKIIWLILLTGYHAIRICIIFLFIKCICWSYAVDFLAYSLEMQYSVVTADQGCSTEMVNVCSQVWISNLQLMYVKKNCVWNRLEWVVGLMWCASVAADRMFIEMRRRALKRFLNLTVRHPILTNDEIVKYFLTFNGSVSRHRGRCTNSCLTKRKHKAFLHVDTSPKIK